MPELPEVETVKRVLEKIVIGHQITKIEILRKSSVPGNQEQFISSLEGETFLSMSRIGKFLIFHLSHDRVIISHLRMEGKYYELDELEPNTKYSRVVLHLENGHKLCYDDSRCFGYLRLSDETSYKEDKELAKLGPEPWDANIKKIMKQVKKSSLPIKSALLSQELMTGLGNIYVDETLYACNIHPLIPANKISEKEWESIKKEASRILKEAIVSGGSTIKSYHPGKDIDGNFQSQLLAYGKSGEKCPKCGAIFRFIKVGGRGTTFCHNCQSYHGKQLKVAITGKISSGKSTVTQIFNDNGYPTLSTDKVVQDLYKQEKVAKLINSTFGLPESKEVNRDLLRNYLVKNPKDIKKVNKLVWPLVKDESILWMKEHPTGIVVVEVPLLFESKMNHLFDVIIGVEAPMEKQLSLLKNRNQDSHEQLQKINAQSQFDENKKKADFIIHNDADLKSLTKKVKDIINKLKCRLD